MTIKDIDLGNEDWIKSTDLENMFSVVVDKRANLVYNLNKGLYIKIDKSILPDFILTHDMHWPLISYKIYGTIHLAWLLYKINDVTTKEIFDIKNAGDKIKYLPKEQIGTIINTINEE